MDYLRTHASSMSSFHIQKLTDKRFIDTLLQSIMLPYKQDKAKVMIRIYHVHKSTKLLTSFFWGVNVFGLWKHNFWRNILHTESLFSKGGRGHRPEHPSCHPPTGVTWSRRVMWHQQPLVTIPWRRQRDSAENSGTFFQHYWLCV